MNSTLVDVLHKSFLSKRVVLRTEFNLLWGQHDASCIICCKDISKLLNKYMPLSFKEKVFCLIKPILYKFKVLELVKKVVK